MHLKEWVVALLLVLFIPSSAYASANFAKMPVSLRQTYRDGTSTDLTCKDDLPCVFTVYGKRALKISLQKEYFGYSISGPVISYHYWPNSGHNLTISLDVACQERDLALVEDKDPFCSISLVRSGNEFVARMVTILSRIGRPQYRHLGDAP